MKMRAKKNRYGGWKEQTLLFLVSQSITLFGSTLVQMAVIWYATRATSSGRWVAVFYICSWLPQFFVSFMGGVFADRYDRKKLIISADTATTLITLCMAVTMGMFRKEQDLLAALLVMSFLRSVSAGIQTPAVNAVIPQLVPGEELIRYNGINAAMQSTVQFAAPAAAGAVLTGGNLHATLMIDVVTAIVGTLILLCVKLPSPVHCSPINGSSVSTIRKSCRLIFREVGEGFRYVFSCKKLKKFLLFYGMFTFLCVPSGFMAGLFVNRVYGEAYWYLTAVEAAGFAGMLAGSIFMSIRGGLAGQKMLYCGLLLFGIIGAGMGMAGNFLLYLVLMIGFGVAMTVVQTQVTATVQRLSREDMQGRAVGLLSSMYYGAMPLGMAVFGPMADRFPMRGIMIGAGIAVICCGLVLIRE